MDKLSIFISSVAQDSLEGIRQKAADSLTDIGHYVVRYEDSIQFTQLDAVKTCLNYVEKSDMLLLYIDTRAGSMIFSEGKTVTHLEFLKAHEEGKQILIYVNQLVMSEFFKFQGLLQEQHRLYETDFEKFCNNLSTLDLTQIQDSYVLAFLYDVYVKGYYFQSINLAIDSIDQLKTQLSVLMKEGLQYLGLKDEIFQALNHFQTYGDFYENSLKILDVIQNGEITNARLLLSRLRLQMEEIEVYEFETMYQTKILTSINPATAITLYSVDTNEMKLVEFDGDVTAESIALNNKESYVVQTAENLDVEEALYYNDDNRLFYFLFKIKSFVFCVHFPATAEMTSEYALRYQNNVLDAIMKSKGYQYCYYLKRLLGG